MKKQNKQKGFTLVELVIVIAVIAILAGVLIPTFSGIVEKANKSAVQQAAANTYKEILALDLADGVQDEKDGETSLNSSDGNYTYEVSDGKLTKFTYKDTKKGYQAVYNGDEWVVSEISGSE